MCSIDGPCVEEAQLEHATLIAARAAKNASETEELKEMCLSLVDDKEELQAQRASLQTQVDSLESRLGKCEKHIADGSTSMELHWAIQDWSTATLRANGGNLSSSTYRVGPNSFKLCLQLDSASTNVGLYLQLVPTAGSDDVFPVVVGGTRLHLIRRQLDHPTHHDATRHISKTFTESSKFLRVENFRSQIGYADFCTLRDVDRCLHDGNRLEFTATVKVKHGRTGLSVE